MDKYSIDSTTLSDIADAIREKTESSEGIKVNEMAGKIGEISGGNIKTCTLHVDGKDLVTSYTYYNESNGHIESGTINGNTDLDNVVCGSVVYIKHYSVYERIITGATCVDFVECDYAVYLINPEISNVEIYLSTGGGIY